MADTHRRVAPLPAAVRVAARRGLGVAAATEAAYFWARPPALEMRWVVLVRTRYFCFVLSCFPGSSHLSALFSRVNMKCDFIGDSARGGNSSFGIFRVQVVDREL